MTPFGLFAICAVSALLASSEAGATQSPMVQCVLGSTTRVVPDYACGPLKDGFSKLRFSGREDAGFTPCAETLGRYAHANPAELGNMCYHMWRDEVGFRARNR